MKSEKEYLRAIELSPTQSRHYMNLANLYVFNQNVFDSVDSRIGDLYDTGIKFSPSNNYYRFRFGEILLRTGLHEQAIESLEGIKSSGHRVENKLSVLGEAYRLSGHLEKALYSVRKQLEINPDDGFTSFVMGKILSDSAEYGESISYFEKALAKSEGGNRLDVMTQLGTAYYNIKDYKNALVYFEQVFESRPNSRALVSLLVLTHRNLGNKKESLRYLNLISKAR